MSLRKNMPILREIPKYIDLLGMMNSSIYLNILHSGQETGLRYFMEKYGEALRFYAYKIIRSKEISEEIVSESFFKLWQSKDRFDSMKGVQSFLYLVTKNACLDYLKSAHKNRMTNKEEEFWHINSPQDDILTHMIYVELIEQITLELKKLPKQQAEVFEMSYLKGMDAEEICKALNTTINNVYYAKSKALSKIRTLLNEKGMGFYLVLIGLIFNHVN